MAHLTARLEGGPCRAILGLAAPPQFHLTAAWVGPRPGQKALLGHFPSFLRSAKSVSPSSAKFSDLPAGKRSRSQGRNGLIGRGPRNLKGISTGDFSEALTAILGEGASGLSATNIVRLKVGWEADYKASNPIESTFATRSASNSSNQGFRFTYRNTDHGL